MRILLLKRDLLRYDILRSSIEVCYESVNSINTLELISIFPSTTHQARLTWTNGDIVRPFSLLYCPKRTDCLSIIASPNWKVINLISRLVWLMRNPCFTHHCCMKMLGPVIGGAIWIEPDHRFHLRS